MDGAGGGGSGGGWGGIGITSGDNSLCGTKPSGSYDISLQPYLKKKKKEWRKKKRQARVFGEEGRREHPDNKTVFFVLSPDRTGYMCCTGRRRP